jgi:hypothetical protein
MAHVARIGAIRIQNFGSKTLKGRGQWEDLGVLGRIKLRFILEQFYRVWNGFIWFRMEMGWRGFAKAVMSLPLA